ncbi:hypothetical protein BSL78_02193 [Apostichopus japonicus]|uniref:Uncharacterized protein n=1 Tax=Stichopus japonicus TaxID=307972 RepID=A0A2G8LKU0_STIJA|nr:hypothetical protein BSL78_02193 [Apostichopus japonicus]
MLMHSSQHKGIIKKSTTTDSTRCYQCIKFLVLLANKCPTAKDYLMSIAPKWQWSVQWLKEKMSDHCWSSSTNQSNESTQGKSFQRTMSAQDTLEEATALLTGLTTQDVFDDLEQSNGDTSQEGSEVNTSSQKEGEENEDMQQEESTTNYDDVDN